MEERTRAGKERSVGRLGDESAVHAARVEWDRLPKPSSGRRKLPLAARKAVGALVVRLHLEGRGRTVHEQLVTSAAQTFCSLGVRAKPAVRLDLHPTAEAQTFGSLGTWANPVKG